MIPLCDPQQCYLEARSEYDAAWHRVMQSGQFILGPEVKAFEREFAEAMDGAFCIGVANGTDAIELILRGLGVGEGDLVLMPSHTAVATVVAVRSTGACPVWVDINPESMVIGGAELEKSLVAVVQAGLLTRVKAVIAVHLYGYPAPLQDISTFCSYHGLALIEDCAQAHGATLNGKTVGTIGIAGAFSFYPTKNMPAFGDGGAILTSNPELAERIGRIRQYGWRQRYISEETGTNSRLDEIQAALLRISLTYLPGWNARRGHIADQYDRAFRGLPVQLPLRHAEIHHAFHQYTIRVKCRDELKEKLAASGIGSGILYPLACHQQPAHQQACPVSVNLENTEQAICEILSLPMYPGLPLDKINTIIEEVISFFDSKGCA